MKEKLEKAHERVTPHLQEINDKLFDLGFSVKSLQLEARPDGGLVAAACVCTIDDQNVQHCFPPGCH